MGSGAVTEKKRQIPSTRETPSLNDQPPLGQVLEFDDWSFFGIWVLGLGFQNQTRFRALARKNGNRSLASAVIVISVDTFSIATWLISTLLSWFKLPYGMMMKRLGNWLAASIRLSRKWSARIGRDELVKRIFAK